MSVQQTQPVDKDDFDSALLQLYPSLLIPQNGSNQQRKRAHQSLICLKTASSMTCTAEELVQKTGLSRFQVIKTMQTLITLGLVTALKTGRKTAYMITTKGTIAMIAFGGFRNWQKIKSSLTTSQKKNDPLAYALLVVGYSSNKPDAIHQTLRNYASQGATIENASSEAAAESLLNFYRQQLRAQSTLPPTYLSVFKEFTTTGFQDFFKMLLVAVKPTAEDYNWLVEFFNEISEFHFNPARVAFVNLLPQTLMLQQKLENFKKNQDQQIKKQDGNLEVTFTIPGSGISKVDAMPPHLRAIGMRLILEPAKFVNETLVEYFWSK